MKRMSPEAKVGLLVLTGLLLLVYMSFKVGKLGFGPGGGYRLTLELDNAVGLAKESEILVAGIPVGLVEDVQLRDGRALLVLRVRDDVRLPQDSAGSLRTQGVLGEKYVEIVPGTAGSQLTDGDVLRAGTPPGDLDRLVTNFNDIAADVKQVTERLARVLGTDEGEQRLREMIAGLRDAAVGLQEVVTQNREALAAAIQSAERLTADLSEIVAGGKDDLRETIANARVLTGALAERAPGVLDSFRGMSDEVRSLVAENRDDVRQSLGNLRDATAKLSTAIGGFDTLVAAANDRTGTLGRLIYDDEVYRDLQTSLGSVRRIAERLESGEGTLGKLLTDDQLYAELTGSVENLRSVTEKIDRGQGTIGKLVNEESVHSNLNETLKGVNDFVAGANRFQFELGYSGEYLTDFGELKNYLTLDIRPRQDYFYHVAIVDDPRGDTTTKTVETTTSDGSGTSTQTTKRKETDDDKLKFSAQVGKRFSLLTVRAGLFESTGGVGADLDFLADRLRLSFEAFDFGRDENPPHLKASARWMFLRNFFLTAGLDDFTYDDNRDFFVGGGVRFLDDDIKYLLSPAAGAVGR